MRSTALALLLASPRDKTISVLREQLTAARRAGVAAASLFKGEKRVSITLQ